MIPVLNIRGIDELLTIANVESVAPYKSVNSTVTRESTTAR